MEEVPAEQHKVHAPVQRQVQDLAERVERVAKVGIKRMVGFFITLHTVFNVGTRMSSTNVQGDTSCWTKPPVDINTKVRF